MIIATAGHVDHGKTLLVKSLTGVDTDRLPDEKKRGLTIDLGFAYAPLPGGGVLGFIDVPGHERFVANMLCGVTGVDFVLFIVAADDGPMPQTEEHLAILDLLGVGRGAVALTKIDRVSPERLAEAKDEIEILFAGSSLEGAPIFPVSGLTGDGIPALKEHLELEAETTEPRPANGNFRLAIDRRFTVPGAGLVVTGTVFSGTVHADDQLVVSPGNAPVRVRGLHAQDRAADSARAGDRCALNIVGGDVGRESIHRGDWVLAPAAHAPVRRIDARIRVLKGEKRPLLHWTPVHVHLGAADVTGRVAVLQGKEIAPGESGLVQLVLDREIGALSKDRLILRDQSALRTVGGGVVVDVFPPRRGRARPDRLAYLAAMEAPDPETALLDLLDRSALGVDLRAFATGWNLTPAEAEALWAASPMRRVADADPPLGFSDDRWDAVRRILLQGLSDWHARRPDHLGPAEEALRRTLGIRLSPGAMAALVARMVADEEIHRQGTALSLPSHVIRLDPKDQKLWDRAQPVMRDAARPPLVREVAEALGVNHTILDGMFNRLARLGLVARVAKNRVVLPEVLNRLGKIAEDLAAASPDKTFAAAEYRDRSDLGRNLTIEILEYFDKTGLTRRRGEKREIMRPADEVFGVE